MLRKTEMILKVIYFQAHKELNNRYYKTNNTILSNKRKQWADNNKK